MTEALPGVWFCALCGEVVFSVGPPSRCPACGAWPALLTEAQSEARALASGRDWSDAVVAGGLSAIQQEMDTAELYSRVATTARSPWLRAAFRALQRIEGRHAALLASIFRVRRTTPTLRPDLAGLTDAARLDLVKAREDDTIGLYGSQLPLVAGTDLETVYRALMEVERDHNALIARLWTAI
jgi:rubrerythrin